MFTFELFILGAEQMWTSFVYEILVNYNIEYNADNGY